MSFIKRQNICIVNVFQPALGIGGVETVCFLLKKELEKNGYNVWSLYITEKTTKDTTDIKLLEEENICSETNVKFFLEIVDRNKIDIILLNGGWENDLLLLCYKIRQKRDIKLVVTSHCNPYARIKEYDDYKERYISNINNTFKKIASNIFLEAKRVWYNYKSLSLTKQLYKGYDIDNIDAFVTLSNSYTKFFKSIFPTKFRKKIHTISNPIVINNNITQNKENIVLFVGRLTSQKRLDRLIYVWNEIYRNFPDWELIVVGNGDYFDEYATIVRNLNVGNIVFVGQQPSEEYFKKSKILCMTSSHEGLPMVLIEAQMYRCVPIAYNSFESITDIIQDKHNGLLIKPFKQKEFAKALSGLISDEKRRKKMANNGIDHIKRFDISNIIKEWITLFESL